MVRHFFSFSCLLFLLFFCDIASAAWSGQAILHLVLGAYIVDCFLRDSLRYELVYLFTLSLESFLYFGRFGLSLTYLLPLMLAIRFTKDSVHAPTVVMSSMLVVALLIRELAVVPFITGSLAFGRYTVGVICASIALMLILKSTLIPLTLSRQR